MHVLSFPPVNFVVLSSLYHHLSSSAAAVISTSIDHVYLQRENYTYRPVLLYVDIHHLACPVIHMIFRRRRATSALGDLWGPAGRYLVQILPCFVDNLFSCVVLRKESSPR